MKYKKKTSESEEKKKKKPGQDRTGQRRRCTVLTK